MRLALAVLLALALGAGLPAPAARAQGPAVWVVSAEGPYTTIQDALAAAAEGDRIEVHGGVHAGPLRVEKRVTLEGVGWPVIAGDGRDSVVFLSAPGIVLRGFEVRASGVEPDRDDSGIVVAAAGISVEGNRLRDVLVGIFVSQADGAILRGNDISGKPQYDLGRKGDGIRLWYSQGALIENNYLHETRDVVMWYSSNAVVRANRIEAGRYGIHLMYSHQTLIEENVLRDNSVGIFAMYSKGIILRQNDIRQQRGSSGYALGFKDADAVEVRGNLLVDNAVGIFIDNTPFTPGGYARFEGNIIAFNDIGVVLLTSTSGAQIEKNTFWENLEQAAIQGGGILEGNLWRGNFWSDYTGFDADGDGQGETPYHAERSFENLTDREPLLRVLIYSPAAQAIELAAVSFPIFKPQPKLSDAQPGAQPGALPAGATSAASGPGSGRMGLTGLGLLAAAGLLAALAVVSPRRIRPAGSSSPGRAAAIYQKGNPMAQPTIAVGVERMTKRYGKHLALEDISFELQVGESLALWGANGAGKTTLLKAILGLIDYNGRIVVAGQDVRRNGKLARRSIGYVPQEAVYYDMSVQATMAFYARLKQVEQGNIPHLLEKLDLSAHAHKPVPALSGGLKQRLALAIALLADPPLLLLDEPTANLDAKSRREHLALLAALRKENKALLFASHRLEEVETLADRILVIEAGQIHRELAPAELRSYALPEVELVLWVAAEQRQQAKAILEAEGLQAHLNGRGTVVVRLAAGEKVRILELLEKRDIHILDFEMEKEETWK
jgi:nitrous oxidase accessory protein